jgi:hypothetical protein
MTDLTPISEGHVNGPVSTQEHIDQLVKDITETALNIRSYYTGLNMILAQYHSDVAATSVVTHEQTTFVHPAATHTSPISTEGFF